MRFKDVSILKQRHMSSSETETVLPAQVTRRHAASHTPTSSRLRPHGARVPQRCGALSGKTLTPASRFGGILQSASTQTQCSFVDSSLFPSLFVSLSTSVHFLPYFESYY